MPSVTIVAVARGWVTPHQKELSPTSHPRALLSPPLSSRASEQEQRGASKHNPVGNPSEHRSREPVHESAGNRSRRRLSSGCAGEHGAGGRDGRDWRSQKSGRIHHSGGWLRYRGGRGCRRCRWRRVADWLSRLVATVRAAVRTKTSLTSLIINTGSASTTSATAPRGESRQVLRTNPVQLAVVLPVRRGPSPFLPQPPT